MLAFAGVLCVMPAQASEKLAQRHNCLSCHSVDKKMVGPAFRDVSRKYRGQSVQETLVAKVKEGGAGNFGPIPMPPNAGVSDADIQKLVKWILSL